jgi:hypothetical protein
MLFDAAATIRHYSTFRDAVRRYPTLFDALRRCLGLFEAIRHIGTAVFDAILLYENSLTNSHGWELVCETKLQSMSSFVCLGELQQAKIRVH